MFVKVVKCSGTQWYANRIGETFEVTNSEFDSYYLVVIGSGGLPSRETFYLDTRDCIVVDKPRSMNSVINYTRRVRCL